MLLPQMKCTEKTRLQVLLLLIRTISKPHLVAVFVSFLLVAWEFCLSSVSIKDNFWEPKTAIPL